MSAARAFLCAALFGLAIAPRTARADATACADGAEKGQELRDRGKLVASHALLLTCSSEACPAPVRKACTEWALDVERRIPSVVVSAADPDGADLPDARVTLDGTSIAVDGRALRVDPGTHMLRGERSGSAPVAITFVAREGEARRLVRLTLTPTIVAQPTPEPQVHRVAPPSKPPLVSVPALVLGGVAVLGLGTFAYFGLTGGSDFRGLERTCSPTCSNDALEQTHTKFIVADVGLVVGIAALAGAVVVTLWRPNAPPRP